MAVSGIGLTDVGYQATYYQRTAYMQTESFYNSISAAATPTTEDNDSEILGLTMIPEEGSKMTYGMKAQYSKESTKDNPVILVTSNYGGQNKSYKVNVNEVNPQNASQLEMFALCSYADQQGMSTHSTFGSYQQLKVCSINAELNGYCSNLSGYDAFLNQTFDWENIVDSIGNDYMNAGDYRQYQTTERLMQMFLKFDHSEAAVTSRDTVAESDTKATVTESDGKSYMEKIQEKIEELLKSLQSPDSKPSFQIGGATYTEEEWEKLLEKVDKIEEAIRKAMEEATGEKMKTTVEETEQTEQTEQKQDTGKTREEVIEEAFTTETPGSTVPATESKKEEMKYLTWYTSEGIFCRKQGQTEGFDWSMKFTEDDQYDKVMDFLHQFDDDENLTFASQENFWKDFLGGKIEEERFRDLYKTVGTDNAGVV